MEGCSTASSPCVTDLIYSSASAGVKNYHMAVDIYIPDKRTQIDVIEKQ